MIVPRTEPPPNWSDQPWNERHSFSAKARWPPRALFVEVFVGRARGLVVACARGRVRFGLPPSGAAAACRGARGSGWSRLRRRPGHRRAARVRQAGKSRGRAVRSHIPHPGPAGGQGRPGAGRRQPADAGRERGENQGSDIHRAVASNTRRSVWLRQTPRVRRVDASFCYSGISQHIRESAKRFGSTQRAGGPLAAKVSGWPIVAHRHGPVRANRGVEG